MNTANRITRLLVAFLLGVCLLEGFLLYHQDLTAGHLLETSDVMAGMSNAAILATIRDNIVHGAKDAAISTIDRNIKSALVRYRKAKDELNFEAPGEAETLTVIQQHFPESEKILHGK